MKKVFKISYYSFLFSSFLILGFFTGKKVTTTASNDHHPDPDITVSSSYSILNADQSYPIPNFTEPVEVQEESSPDELMPTDFYIKPVQENVLFIIVDELQKEKPLIEGIWIALYFKDTSQLTLMPIYPSFSLSDDNNSIIRSVQKDYKTNPGQFPGENLLANLKSRNLWWIGYIVLDKFAIQEMINILAQTSDYPDKFIPIINNLESLPSPQGNLQISLQAQTKLIQDLCLEVSTLSFQRIQSNTLQLTPNHYQSDLNLHDLLEDWQIRLAQNNPLACEFPFLKPE